MRSQTTQGYATVTSSYHDHLAKRARLEHRRDAAIDQLAHLPATPLTTTSREYLNDEIAKAVRGIETIDRALGMFAPAPQSARFS